MHARRYFFDARLTDPERAHEALARIRALYAVEREAKEKGLTGADLAAYRQQHAGPVLAAFADWLAEQRPRVLPKSAIGEAFTYATNQWPTLGVYLTDGRLTIDNAAAEQAIRPLWRRPPELAAPGRGRRVEAHRRAAERHRLGQATRASTRGCT